MQSAKFMEEGKDWLELREWDGFLVAAGKGDLDAQQVSLMRYFNHRLPNGPHSLEMGKVGVSFGI